MICQVHRSLCFQNVSYLLSQSYYVSVMKTFGAVANEQCIMKNFPAAGLELVGLVTSGVGISTPQ